MKHLEKEDMTARRDSRVVSHGVHSSDTETTGAQDTGIVAPNGSRASRRVRECVVRGEQAPVREYGRRVLYLQRTGLPELLKEVWRISLKHPIALHANSFIS